MIIVFFIKRDLYEKCHAKNKIKLVVVLQYPKLNADRNEAILIVLKYEIS